MLIESTDQSLRIHDARLLNLIEKNIELMTEINQLKQELKKSLQVIALYEHCDELDWTEFNNQE